MPFRLVVFDSFKFYMKIVTYNIAEFYDSIILNSRFEFQKISNRIIRNMKFRYY